MADNNITKLGNQEAANAFDDGMYMKLLLLVIKKYNLGDVVITPDDVTAEYGNDVALVVGFANGNIELSVTDMETAIELGRIHDDSTPKGKLH